MALRDHRTTYLPLRRVRKVNSHETEIIALHAGALWNQERFKVDDFLTDFVEYEVEQRFEFSAPSISYHYYGTVNYYWIICHFNGVIDPTTELKEGLKIKIPKLTQIENWLNTMMLDGEESVTTLQV